MLQLGHFIYRNTCFLGRWRQGLWHIQLWVSEAPSRPGSHCQRVLWNPWSGPSFARVSWRPSNHS